MCKTLHTDQKGSNMDSETFAREVGRFVRERRKALGISQHELALMTGVSRRFIISLEMGETPGVRMSTLLQAFDALGISIALSIDDEQMADQPRKDFPSLMSEKRDRDDERRYEAAFASVVENLGRPIE